MSDNKITISTHIHKAWNKGDFEKVSSVLAHNFFYKTTFTDEILNSENYIGLIEALRAAMPELSVEIELIMSDDNYVMTQVSFIGEVKIPVFGIPVSEKIISFPAMTVWELHDNKIISADTLIDITGVSRQVGSPITPQVPLSIRSGALMNLQGIKKYKGK